MASLHGGEGRHRTGLRLTAWSAASVLIGASAPTELAARAASGPRLQRACNVRQLASRVGCDRVVGMRATALRGTAMRLHDAMRPRTGRRVARAVLVAAPRRTGDRGRDLPDRSRSHPGRKPVRFQGRVRPRSCRRTTSASRSTAPTTRPCWEGRRQFVGERRRRERVGARVARRQSRPGPAATSSRPAARGQDAAGRLGGLRHRTPQGEERHPVHRRRSVDCQPDRGPHPVEGAEGGQVLRTARVRRHAAHGADRHVGRRLDHHRQRERDERLHDRDTSRASTRSASMWPATRTTSRTRGSRRSRSW